MSGWLALQATGASADLITRWTFDGASANDTAGEFHSLPQGDVKLTTDEGRSVAQFGGNGSIVIEGGRNLFSRPEPFSLEVVVKPTAFNDGKIEPFLLGKPSYSWGLSYFRQGQIYGYINVGSNSIRAIEKNSIPLNKYSHAILVHDPSLDGTNFFLYINAVLVDSKRSAHPLVPNEVDVVIGQPGFEGMIDEARIYKHALTAEEVKDSMKKFPAAASSDQK